MENIAILLPCYNESKTIGKVVRDFREVFDAQGMDATIYVYDNNSTDGTDTIAREAGAIVRYEHKQGKGNVIRRMFREIDAECYIMADGDDTYPAQFAPEMAKKVLERKVDMVVGDRLSSTYYEENKRPFHNVGNAFVCSAINRIFRTTFKDIMTGYRAFGYEFVKTFPLLSGGFEIETEMSIHAADKNMFVENVVIEYRDRPDGRESKLNTFRDGFKVIRMILRLFRTYQPMKFFGLLASVLALIGIVFFIPVLRDYLITGLVPRFPTLTSCCFAWLAALMAFFAGLMLETITWKNRQDFELALLQAHNRFIEKNTAE